MRNSVEFINNTFIVLILMVPNPTLLSQFNPISFCNVSYMIVSKVLAKWLKVMLLDIISLEQSAFVPGRLITYIIISDFEGLHFLKINKAKKHRSCSLNIDMMKAYDHVEWDYLEAVMGKLGFSHA